MSKVKVAWEACDGITPDDVRNGRVLDLIGFQEIGCHIVLDVKMDFTRKARFVAGGHTTEALTSITYSSVVSRDSVRIGFLIAALNNLDIMVCDLENAYLNAPCREKIWFEGGAECGEQGISCCQSIVWTQECRIILGSSACRSVSRFGIRIDKS